MSIFIVGSLKVNSLHYTFPSRRSGLITLHVTRLGPLKLIKMGKIEDLIAHELRRPQTVYKVGLVSAILVDITSSSPNFKSGTLDTHKKTCAPCRPTNPLTRAQALTYLETCDFPKLTELTGVKVSFT
jgi:hypothetical protein